MMAPVCSSFSDMCASQSGRSIVCPLGDTSLPWVRIGNLLAHRCRLRIGRYAIVLTDAEFVSVYNKPTSSWHGQVHSSVLPGHGFEPVLYP